MKPTFMGDSPFRGRGGLSSRAVSAPSSPEALRGLALIALAAVSWGTTGAVTTVLVSRAGATPLVIGAARMLIAAVLLVASARGLAGARRAAAGDRARCVVAGVCNAGFQAAYFTSVTLTGIAITALIAICSAPILITALAALVLGERPSRRLALSVALGVAGTTLLVIGPGATAGAPSRSTAGVAFALLAGLAYALYVVVAKAAVARMAPLPVAAWTFATAAVVMAPALLQAGVVRQIELGWPWLVYLGAVTTAAAYAAYTVGLRHVPAAAAGVAALLEPLTATLLGVLAFGERLGSTGWLGAVLLLAALVLVAIPVREPAST
jgi:DME family drug/metabolite transporter